MNHAAAPGRLLGQSLIVRGALTADQLHIALIEQTKRRQPIGKVLVALGFVSETTLREALAESSGRRSIDLSRTTALPEALALLPRDFAYRHRMLPLDYDSEAGKLTLAAGDPDDLVALDRLRATLPPGCHIELLQAGESEIVRAIDRCYGHELSIDGILHEIQTGQAEHVAAGEPSGSQPVARLIDALLTDAVKQEASDIHFEPEPAFLRIRYRIDGVLRPVRALHDSFWPAMMVRLKVMAGMNIAESRAPQDGRIGMYAAGRNIDIRVASQPTLHGENLVLRILDRSKGLLPIGQLGLPEAALGQLKTMIARPEGIILVTGPTGSGKTTTLYSLLNHINSEAIHIMTLEDPVEYLLPLARQTSVGDPVKLDFANGIRSMMRQDPDVILVGEIRDAETAEMAFRAAMTGHQVYSTLHANSAIGALPRLIEIGVAPDILAGNIIGIVAQRLVRRLCEHCKQPYLPDAGEIEVLAGGVNDPPSRLFRPSGCPHCSFQGYRGRLALMEVLCMNDALDELVARRASRREIRDQARQAGFQTLAEDGLRRVREGITSLAEVARVVDLTDRRQACASPTRQ